MKEGTCEQLQKMKMAHSEEDGEDDCDSEMETVRPTEMEEN